MLHIFLTILKIPFILLAVLLLLILIVLLLVLLVPVRYRITASKDSNLEASGKVHWLFHLLSVRADYREKDVQLTVRIFGYPLIGKKPKRQKVTKAQKQPDHFPAATEREQSVPAKKEPEKQMQEPEKQMKEPEKQKEDTEKQKEDTERQKEDAEKQKEDTKKRKEHTKKDHPQKKTKNRIGIMERIRQIRDKIKNSFSRILEKIRSIQESIRKLKTTLESYRELWYDSHTQASYGHIKKELRYLLKHYLPGKMTGKVLFGLEDPALTGQLLGICSVLQVFTGNQVQVFASFEEPVLEGDLYVKGHVRGCHAVKTLLSLLIDRHCRITWKRVRKLMGQ